MDWNNKLRHAIEKHVNDKNIAELFSKALDYSYVFDLLREDESLPMPEYSEFEYREKIMSDRVRKIELTCKQLNSDVEVGVVFESFYGDFTIIEIGSF